VITHEFARIAGIDEVLTRTHLDLAVVTLELTCHRALGLYVTAGARITTFAVAVAVARASTEVAIAVAACGGAAFSAVAVPITIAGLCFIVGVVIKREIFGIHVAGSEGNATEEHEGQDGRNGLFHGVVSLLS